MSILTLNKFQYRVKNYREGNSLILGKIFSILNNHKDLSLICLSKFFCQLSSAYKELAWLNPHVKMRTTFTNIEDEDTQSVDQSGDCDFEQYTDPVDSSFELLISSNTPTSGEQASTVNSAGAGMKRKWRSSSGTKRPKWHQKEGVLKSQESDRIKILNYVIEQPGKRKDEHDIFGACVAASLRNFRPKDQAIARNIIHNLIFGIEMSALDQPGYEDGPSSRRSKSEIYATSPAFNQPRFPKFANIFSVPANAISELSLSFILCLSSSSLN